MPDNDKVLTRPSAGGVDMQRPAEDAAALESLGESKVSTEGLAVRAAQAAVQRRRDSFDTAAEKALVFAEGVVDALSLGFLHLHGEAADIRRDVNSGSAMAGEMVGTGVGLLGGPVEAVAGMGRKAGSKAAKAVLGEVKAGSRAAIGVKTAEGAGEMGALMGATSIGHQTADALIDDKEFSAAAAIHEAGLGAIMGGGFSFLSGVFSKAAKKYEIQAQGGILDPTSEASQGLHGHFGKAVKGFDDALDTHAQRLGVLKQLEAEGLLDQTVPQFLAEREVALAKAQGAQKVLQGLDLEAAFKGKPKDMQRYVTALEEYEAQLGQLDDLMRARQLERVKPQEPGAPLKDPGPAHTQNVGLPQEWVADMDARMANPKLAAEYEAVHGRPYEPQVKTLRTDGEPLPGGQVSPTSELATPVEFAKGTPRTAAPAVEGPWQPSSPPGRFNPAEWTPARVHGELGEGRVLSPTTPAVEAENVLSNAHPDLAKDQLALPDGYFIPAADARQNAVAFENFRGRMATDTPMGPTAVPSRMPSPVELGAAPGVPAVEAKTPVIAKGSRPGGQAIPESTPTKPAAAQPRAEITEGQRAVRRYLDEWYATSDAMGPKMSPGDAAAAHIRKVMSEVQGITGGREISAGPGTEALGLKSRTSLGATLNDIYALRRLAELGADASKSTVMSGQRGNRFLNWAMRKTAGRGGASMLGGAIGHKLGGPVGYFAGAALAYKYVGFGGRVAGASGRLYQKTVKAASALLAGSRSTMFARAASGNSLHKDPSANRPVAYSERGVIKDPVERIEDLRRAASSPATLADFVARASGDLNLVSPDFVSAAVQQVQAQLGFLLSKTPPLAYDQLGRPIRPTAGALRRFMEAENAVFDLDGLLTAVQKGRVTQVQVEALQQAHAPVYTKIAAFLLSDPEKLQQLERAKLRTIQMVTGVPLTPSADPTYVMRNQVIWEQARQMAPQPGPAQALKINGASRPPSEGPLPSQSTVAPGNSR